MADHRDDDIVVLKEPTKRTIIINRHNPTLWPQIINEIKPFIRCHTECFGETSPGTTTKHHVLLSTPSPLTTPGYENTQGCSEFPLMKLPNELIIEILERVVGSYDLQAYLPTFPSFPTLLILKRPRTWKSIRIFHICKAIRELAIKMYGNPHKHALPFNSNMDKLVIQQSIDSEDAKLLAGNKEMCTHWRWPYREPYEITKTCHCLNWGLWTSKAYCETYADVRRERDEFVQRIRHVDISILSRPVIGSGVLEWGFRPWRVIFHCLSTILPNLEELEIAVNHYDNCTSEDTKHPSLNLYRYRDMSFFDGLRFAATTGNHFFYDEPHNPNFLPQLKQVRVVRSRNRCALTFDRHYEGPDAESIFGDWSYDAGVEDKWTGEKTHDE
ncbi:hypothetical protein F5Y02DRAFT_426886 [Annulohypoxylon stygium]|nr:hypothetical protein F5Y02DRAFT_426886 [Annulohypoxylon stygium]